jgi:hypothetical protein
MTVNFSETVPDREISQGSRKLQEWEDHVEKVSQLKKKDSEIVLYEEEKFVDFVCFRTYYTMLRIFLLLLSYFFL